MKCLVIGIDGADNRVLKKFKLTKGDTVVIYPDEYHWTTNSKNSRWINFLTRKFDQKKPDLFN